jgi:hypothetical protein
MNSPVCTEMMQACDMPYESSTWRAWPLFAHKVIHRTRGHLEKALPIMDLAVLLEVKPPMRAQLHTEFV